MKVIKEIPLLFLNNPVYGITTLPPKPSSFTDEEDRLYSTVPDHNYTLSMHDFHKKQTMVYSNDRYYIL